MVLSSPALIYGIKEFHGHTLYYSDFRHCKNHEKQGYWHFNHPAKTLIRFGHYVI